MICINYEKLSPHIRLTYSQKLLSLAYIFFMSSLFTTFSVTMYICNMVNPQERDFLLLVYLTCLVVQISGSCLLLKLAKKIRLYNAPDVIDNENEKDLA